jgi:hypothetical protein
MDGAASRAIVRVLASGRDVWGEALLAAPNGPTYEGVRSRLAPLLYARAPGGRALTASGVYYVPSGDSAAAAGLHVADGSEIIRRHVGGASLTIRVDGERYGSCLARLTPAALLDGYLPVLETSYVDAHGRRTAQESFTTDGGTFVSLTSTGADVELGTTVVRGAGDVYATWTGGSARLIGRGAYTTARAAFVRRWRARLAGAFGLSVPEQVVLDARRALLVQDLLLGWRYSIGNAYEEFSYPESPDVATVLGEQGFPAAERAILETSLTRRNTPFPNWKRGERLLATAAYVRRSGDRAYLVRVTPTLRRFVAELAAGLGRNDLLGRERYSADIPDLVYAFHGQVVAWAGLRAIAGVWGGADAAAARRVAARLERGLRAAVRRSERRLPDGSLFVPARLLDDEAPYDSLVEARSGSYWNLVTPYALATGFFPPHGDEARGVIRYLLRHGSRLLGLVRAGAYALYGHGAPFPVSGTDDVYGTSVARFLADNDRPDQLVLSLYGQLGAALTPGTFVAGEGASVAPLDGARYRSMYLPPNAAADAAFLETLRVMLVHETANGLELAFATPRGWLRPGGRIAVTGAPTRFGPVSYTIAASRSSAHVHVDAPPVPQLALRLRLPSGVRIRSVRPVHRFAPASGTIELSGARGPVDLDVSYG